MLCKGLLEVFRISYLGFLVRNCRILALPVFRALCFCHDLKRREKLFESTWDKVIHKGREKKAIKNSHSYCLRACGITSENPGTADLCAQTRDLPGFVEQSTTEHLTSRLSGINGLTEKLLPAACGKQYLLAKFHRSEHNQLSHSACAPTLS